MLGRGTETRRDTFLSVADALVELAKHLPGQHDQLTHGRRGGGGMVLPVSEAAKRWTESSSNASRLQNIAGRITGGGADVMANSPDAIAARTLLDAIQTDGKVYPRLFRGVNIGGLASTDSVLGDYKVGTILEFPLLATSRRSEVASDASWGSGTGIRVRFTLLNARGLSVSRWSRHPKEDEVLTSGRFRVSWSGLSDKVENGVDIELTDLGEVKEAVKHLPGQHDQSTHGRGGGRGGGGDVNEDTAGAAAALKGWPSQKMKSGAVRYTNPSFRPPEGESVELYHVTSAMFVPGIVKEGLDPNNYDSGSVWYTKTNSETFTAIGSPSWKADAVVAVEIPSSHVSRVPLQGWQSYRTAKPEWIRTISLFPDVVTLEERTRREAAVKHLPGQHDQLTHGRGGGGGGNGVLSGETFYHYTSGDGADQIESSGFRDSPEGIFFTTRATGGGLGLPPSATRRVSVSVRVGSDEYARMSSMEFMRWGDSALPGESSKAHAKRDGIVVLDVDISTWRDLIVFDPKRITVDKVDPAEGGWKAVAVLGGAGLRTGEGALRDPTSASVSGLPHPRSVADALVELAKHLPGQHDQLTHGRRGGGGSGNSSEVDNYLRVVADLSASYKPEGWKYGSVEELILKEGKALSHDPYTPDEERQVLQLAAGTQWKMKECFKNATKLAMKAEALGIDAHYAEGFGLPADLRVGLAFQHAVATLNGKPVDFTWKPLNAKPRSAHDYLEIARANLRGSIYRMLELPTDYVEARARARGTYDSAIHDLQGGNLLKTGVPPRGRKHLPGQHDQSTHGRRGGGGEAAVEEAARDVLKRARLEEPDVTATLARLEDGVSLQGLPFRLKSEGSLIRKIAERARVENAPPSQVAAGITDVLRYTYTSDAATYSNEVRGTLATLGARGFRTVKVKNYWESGDAYQGINTVLETRGGLRFELQFHTPKSYNAKGIGTHKLYEEWRTTKDRRRRIHLFEEMKRIMDAVPVPPGALSVKSKKAAPPAERWFTFVDYPSGGRLGLIRMTNVAGDVRFEYRSEDAIWVEEPSLMSVLWDTDVDELTADQAGVFLTQFDALPTRGAPVDGA